MQMAARGTLVLLATLLAGAALGVAGDRLLGHRRPMGGMRGGPGQEFKALGLSPAQCAAIDTVLQRSRPRMAAAFAELEPRMRAVSDSIRADIRAVLTPGQQEKFDRMSPRERGFGMGRSPGPAPRGGLRDSLGLRGGRGRAPSICR